MLNARTTVALVLTILALSQTPSLANGGPTEPECECPPVTGVSVITTVTSATVSWTTSSIYSSFVVQILVGNTVYFQTSTTGGSVVFNGTSPGTSYTARVYGVCGDLQAHQGGITFNTVPGVATCGEGPADIGGSILVPAFLPLNSEGIQEQIDFLGDVDAYRISVPCDGIVTVTLSSLLNDYDLHITVNGGNIFSKRPGTLSETITFPLTAGASALAVVRGYGTAYNTFDCYSIGATGPFPCFTGGGGGENMTSSDGSGANTSPIVKDGSLLLPFESAFQNDEQIDVQVFSTDGRLVLSESTQVFGGENQVKLDLPSISDGIYLVNIKGSFGIKSHKVVVAK